MSKKNRYLNARACLLMMGAWVCLGCVPGTAMAFPGRMGGAIPPPSQTPGGPTQPTNPAPPSTSAYNPKLPPVSSSNVQNQIKQAGQLGDMLLSHGPQMSFQKGGQKGLGTATLGHQKIPVNRLVPNTANSSYITRLEKANNGKNLLGLKKMYDTVTAHAKGHPDVTTQASTIAHNTAASRTYTHTDVEHDSSMNASALDVHNAQSGSILGSVFAACSSKTVTTPTSTTGTINNEKTCTKVLVPGEGGPACTRTRMVKAAYTTLDGSLSAALNVNTGANKQECKRETTVTKLPTTLHQSRDATLAMTKEKGGLSCTRQISANLHATHTSGSASGYLPIDTEKGGNSCKRTVHVKIGKAKLLATFKQTYGMSKNAPCSSKTAFHLAGGLPSGTETVDILGPYLSPQSGGGGGFPKILQKPTKANGWVFIVGGSCSKLSDATHHSYRHMADTATPQVHLAPMRFFGSLWYYDINAMGAPSRKVSVSDSGNCGDQGTASCPTRWTCSTKAPTTIDGVKVTRSDTRKVAPLFSGASSSCAIASLNRVCSGSASTSGSISILPDLPSGITRVSAHRDPLYRGVLPVAYAAPAPGITFSNFSWKVTNPQKGVTVSLTEAPGESDGWKAHFKVTRTDFNYVPHKPHVTMSWTVTTSTVVYGKGDQGNCSDTGSAACPTQWKCVQNAPATIDGYPISTAIAAKYYPLFPGAGKTCTEGELDRVCDGSSSLGSTVGIGDLLPTGTKTISDFKWVVTNPSKLLTVTLLAPPTYANGWAASFKVTRHYNGKAAPPAPNVQLTWNVAGPDKIVIGYQDTGDCGVSNGDQSCKLDWTCTTDAPQTIDGVKVTAPNPEPLFPGANPKTCLDGTLAMVCAGSGSVTDQVSIASKIYKGDQKISDYAWKVTKAIPGVKVTSVQVPSLANRWVAIFKTTRTEWDNPPIGKPAVSLTWKMRGPPTFTFNVTDTGNCATQSTPFCSVSWTCDTNAPVTVDGIVVPPAVVKKQPALFPNDGGTCMKATLNYDCKSTWGGQGGQVCWTNAQGKKQCVTIPASGVPPDTCKSLENNPKCVLKVSDCANGAMDKNGFCHVRTYEYDCITKVKVPDGNTKRVTQCTSAQPCLNGSCTPPKKDTNPPSDMDKSLAHQVEAQTITSDWTWSGAKKAPPLSDFKHGTMTKTPSSGSP